MNKISMTVAALAAALLAGAAQADDKTAAQKAADSKVVSQKAAVSAEGAHDNHGAVSAEGANDLKANTGMKATGASLSKSEGANDHQH